MTTPGGAGGGGQNVNLSTLWLPISAETSHLIQEVERAADEAGKVGRQAFERSFGSLDTTFARSFSNIGSQLTSQLTTGLTQALQRVDLAGIGNATSGLMRGFEGVRNRTQEANQALVDFHRSHEQLASSIEREAVAQSRMNDLRSRGTATVTQMLVAQTNLDAAHRRVATSVEADAAAHQRYQSALEGSKTSMAGFALETGIVSGAVSAGVMLASRAFEGLAELGKRVFETVVEGVERVAEEVVHVGEVFEELNRDLTVYSSASGQALTDLEDVATGVYATLDTSTKNLGQTMGVLRSRFGDLATDTKSSNAALGELSRDLLEVGDRMGAVNVREFAAAMHQFGIDGADADRMLAVMAGDAQAFGVTIQGLTSDMVTAGPTLTQFGVGAEAAAQGIAKMDQAGINVNRTMMAVMKSAQEAGKSGNAGDLKQFIADTLDAIREYEQKGRTGEALSLADTVFGARNAAQALKAGQDLLDMLNNIHDETGRIHTPEGLHDWEDATETLHNKWQRFVNDFTASLKPLGEKVMGGLGDALDWLKNWFDAHQSDIIDKIKDFGEAFIRSLPAIKRFGEDVVDVFKYIGVAVQLFAGSSMVNLGLMVEPMAKLLEHVPGFRGLGHDLDDAGKALISGGRDLLHADIKGTLDGIKEKIEGLNIDVPGLTEKWDNLTQSWKEGASAAESQQDALSKLNDTLKDQAQHMVPQTPGAAPGAYYAPPTTTSSSGPVIRSAASVTGGNTALTAALQAQGVSAEQIRLIQAFSTVEGNNPAGNPTLGFTDSQLGGRSDLQSHVAALLQQFQARAGVAGAFPAGAGDQAQAQWIAKVVGQSGLSSDWQGNQQPLDYVPRVMAAMQGVNVSGGGGVSPAGYGNIPVARGGTAPDAVDAFSASVSGHPYQYGGYGDPGHQGLFDCSGFMSAIYGMMTGKAMPGDARFFTTTSDFQSLGFIPTDRPVPGTFQIGVSSGHMAGTLPSGVNVESGGAADKTQYGGSAAGAWDQQFPQHYYLPAGSAGGPAAAAFTAGFHTASGPRAPAWPTPPRPPAGPGVTSSDQDASGGYWITAPGFDARIYVRPGETPSQAMERQRSVEQSQKTLGDDATNLGKLDQAQKDAQKAFDDLDRQKNDASGKDFRWEPGGENYKKWQDAQNKLNSATDALSRARERQAGDTQEQTIAQQKQFEDQTKPPTGGARAGAGGPAEDLGRGFLKGIFDSLGLGNVLGGKSPLEWGSVKMGLGALNWGLGVMNSMGLTNANPAAQVALGGLGPALGGGGGGGLPIPSVPQISPFGPGRGPAPGPPAGTPPAAPGAPQVQQGWQGLFTPPAAPSTPAPSAPAAPPPTPSELIPNKPNTPVHAYYGGYIGHYDAGGDAGGRTWAAHAINATVHGADVARKAVAHGAAVGAHTVAGWFQKSHQHMVEETEHPFWQQIGKESAGKTLFQVGESLLKGEYAAGGGVSGGRGGIDDIPALLTGGEYVMTRNATTMFRPVLERMNAAGARGYDTGGIVDHPDVMPFGHIADAGMRGTVGSRGAATMFGNSNAAQALGAQHNDYSIHVNNPQVHNLDELRRTIKEEQASRLYTISSSLPAPSVGSP